MAHYLVSAKPKWDSLEQLAERVRSGEVRSMKPFGQALDKSMRGARLRGPQEAVWEEEDYCRPPLKMERDAVLDEYFDSIEVERVEPGDGWDEIADLPKLWDSVENATLNE